MLQILKFRIKIIYLIFIVLAQYSLAAVSPVSVDVDHGFYDSAFTLRLSCGSQGQQYNIHWIAVILDIQQP